MDIENIKVPKIGWKKFTFYGGLAMVALAVYSGLYTVEEGNIGVVKRFGEANRQSTPGLHVRIPIVEEVKHIEIRERKNEEIMIAGTEEQMQLTGTKASVNWKVRPEATMDLYRQFGTISQFEVRKLDPLFLTAVKTGLGKYKVAVLVAERDAVADTITNILKDEIFKQDLPVEITGLVNIEDFGFPKSYEDSIQTKLTAKELDLAESFNLSKQAKISQRTTKQAEADRDATKARADGNKYRIEQESIAKAAAIKREGEATAEAIAAQTESMAGNPLFVEYTRWKNWNGALPKVQMGESPSMIVDLNKLSNTK